MRSALQLPMFMMRPPSFMYLAAACVAAKTARTLIANARSKSESLISVNGPNTATPALLTRMSMPPRYTHSALDGANDCVRVGAIGLDGNGPNSRCLCSPGYFICSVRRTGIGERNVGTILGKPMEIAAPIPRLPPVTRARLLVSGLFIARTIAAQRQTGRPKCLVNTSDFRNDPALRDRLGKSFWRAAA